MTRKHVGVVGPKGGAGVFQRVISWIPPHRIYCEPFAGEAAVFRNKRPARRSILIDVNPGAPEVERRAFLAALADEFRDELVEYLDVDTAAGVEGDRPILLG